LLEDSVEIKTPRDDLTRGRAWREFKKVNGESLFSEDLEILDRDGGHLRQDMSVQGTCDAASSPAT